jgi:hypothetical protein
MYKLKSREAGETAGKEEETAIGETTVQEKEQ